jgi:hypothetical protein
MRERLRKKWRWKESNIPSSKEQEKLLTAVKF